ncbi:MAG: hypothetical protein JWQ06_1737 [Mucilaginibacter sp.]|nr:hypothetical protein [Mucilaginibacter sp.]
MKKRFLLLFSLLLAAISSEAQKWQPGYFYDVKGSKVTGLIRLYPSGRGPVKDEAFVEYREDAKASAIKLSASDLRSFTVARDSFVVAANGGWSPFELDFVRVALNTPLRLYQAQGYGGGGGSGIGIGPEIGAGIGTGGFGGGFGGGISIPIGGGRKGPKSSIYFYGSNTANMKPIDNQNFVDIMSEVMADEPDAVEQIKLNKYNLGSMEKLIAYYNKLQDSHKSQNQ